MKVKKLAVCLAAVLILSTLVCAGYAGDEGKLNLNKATVEELAKIPGLTKELAQKIIEYRKNNGGGFVDMEELLDVPGIDNKLLRELKKHLFIEDADDCNC